MQRPGFLMMDLLRALYWVDEGLQNGLKARGWQNVSRSQSLILLNIAFGVQRASVLARNLGISRQAISQMLAEMQNSKLVEIEPDPEDRRAQIVVFSRDSSSLRDDAMKTLAEIEGQLEKLVGKRRLAVLREVLAMDWGPAVTF